MGQDESDADLHAEGNLSMDIFERAEESRLEILSNARTVVVAMPAGISMGRVAARRPVSGFIVADGSSVWGCSSGSAVRSRVILLSSEGPWC